MAAYFFDASGLVKRYVDEMGTVWVRSLTDPAAIAELHGLRGYDAVQLATALQANATRRARRTSALTLISADIERNAAAVAEGLTVDDPNAHP